MVISFKGAHVSKAVILMGVLWYGAYPLSTRHVEALMAARGVELDHATIHRWVITYSPLLEEAFHHRKRPMWVSWRLDETASKGKGEWRDVYRAVDTYAQTIACLLTEQRDEHAAKTCLTKAIRRHGGVPDQISIAGRTGHEAAIKRDNEAHGTARERRQITYLHHVVEQAHRGVKRVTQPLRGCKSFEVAQSTCTGIELRHMRRTGQLEEGIEEGLTPAQPFDALAS